MCLLMTVIWLNCQKIIVIVEIGVQSLPVVDILLTLLKQYPVIYNYTWNP